MASPSKKGHASVIPGELEAGKNCVFVKPGGGRTQTPRSGGGIHLARRRPAIMTAMQRADMEGLNKANFLVNHHTSEYGSR